MTQSRALPVLLGLFTALLASSAVFLALNNPTIDGTSRGDDYQCSAPYDTVLNDEDDVPGGEPARDGDAIASRCRDLGTDRFVQGVSAGSAAVLFAGAAIALGMRRRLRRNHVDQS